MANPWPERGPSKIEWAKSSFPSWERPTGEGVLPITIAHPSSDLWVSLYVQMLECEQPTLEEKIRGKLKGDKTVYIHVYLRMLMPLLDRQQV